MKNFAIYGYNERAGFADSKVIAADSLPTACNIARGTFPPGCVTNAIAETPDCPADSREMRVHRFPQAFWDAKSRNAY